jgi:hypothetical protein
LCGSGGGKNGEHDGSNCGWAAIFDHEANLSATRDAVNPDCNG